MIERIEQFRPELQAMSFPDPDEFRDNHIPLVVPAASNHSLSCITELTWGRIRQLTDIEPSIDGPLVARQVRVTEQIGVRPDERDSKRRRRQRWAVLECPNGPDLPVGGDCSPQILAVPEKRNLVQPARD